MTFEITITKEIFYWTMLLILWGLLPFVLNIKSFMSLKEKRTNKFWCTYGLIVCLPNLVILLTLVFIVKLFNFIVKILDNFIENIMFWIFPDEEH